MSLINDIAIAFALSIVVILICYKIRVPVIVGFLLTGILIGPHGLGLVRAAGEVEILAEIGVVLLLFTIGLEFSLGRLVRIKRLVLGGGALQVAATALIVYLLTGWLGLPWRQAMFWGFLISISSTAIVLKILQEKAELDSPHGRAILGILIFQDIIVVPMMLLTPYLGGTAENGATGIATQLVLGAAVIGLMIVGAKWIVPWVLQQVVRTRNREVFLLAVVVLCLAAAQLTHAVGLSLALGAFLAGLVISETDFNLQVLGSIMPFRDLFTSLFFISIGMLLDVGALADGPHLLLVLLIVPAIIVGKGAIAAGVARLLGLPGRTALLSGIAVAQIGEFSFVLSRTGRSAGLLDAETYNLFLAVAVLSMAAAPFVLGAARPLSVWLGRKAPESDDAGDSIPTAALGDHLVIVGFGVNGRNLARAARMAAIPYIVLEMNPDTVRAARAEGEPIYFGDATSEAVLEHIHLTEARIAVVAINDAAATRCIAEHIHRLSPGTELIVRTRYVEEVEALYRLGVNEVIPEEFETSIEIFARVLGRYLVPAADIENLIRAVRSEGYEMLRGLAPATVSRKALQAALPDLDISTIRVPESAPWVGKSLAEMRLRQEPGVTVAAIVRSEGTVTNPGPETVIAAGDRLVVLGRPEQVSEAGRMLGGGDDTRS